MTADTPGELPGKRLLGSRRTEKQGVREVRAVFEDANLIFQEVDLGNDIGKDAYVDLSEGGRFRGAMVALQIKAGASYRDGANYQIPCNAHDRAVWSGSVVPVYGMVYDPDADTIHWINLTTWSRGLKEGERSSSCPVPRGNLLAPETVEAWVTIVRSEIAKQIRPPLLDLMSTDAQRQVAAVSECFGLGRSDPRPLKLLRASLRWLADVDASWPAIQILSFCTPHPDLLWSAETWLADEVKRDVSGVFRWSVEEAEFLIAAPTGDMWNRGDLGQSVYMLLAADPGCDDLLAAVVGTTDDDEIRWRATTVRVARAGEDGLEVLDRLAEAVPELRRAELFRELRQTLLEHGSVSLW